MRRIGLLTTLALLAAVSPARADRRNPLENQPSIRHRVEMRKTRFEVTPQFMVSMNQDFRHFIGGGLVLQFHLNDWLGIAVQGAYGGGVDTDLTGRLNTVLPENPAPPQPSRRQFQDHLASINAAFSAYLALTPVAGKLALFGVLFLKYDLYAAVGFGGLLVSNTYDSSRPDSNDSRCTGDDPNKCDPLNAGFKPGLMIGVGTHLFFNDWVGLNLEIRDFVVATNAGGLDVNGDRKVTGDDEKPSNNLFVGIGLTLMLPPTAKISD